MSKITDTPYRELIAELRAYGESIAPYTEDGDTVLKAADAIEALLAQVGEAQTEPRK